MDPDHGTSNTVTLKKYFCNFKISESLWEIDECMQVILSYYKVRGGNIFIVTQLLNPLQNFMTFHSLGTSGT